MTCAGDEPAWSFCTEAAEGLLEMSDRWAAGIRRYKEVIEYLGRRITNTIRCNLDDEVVPFVSGLSEPSAVSPHATFRCSSAG